MKFKYVQTRLVRYTVVIEADSVDEADDQVFNHEEWNEEGVEESDPPWRENCPEDTEPDVYIVHGYIIPFWEYLNPAKEGMVGCDGSAISVGSRVMYKRGKWDGAPWFPATVTYLYDVGRGRGLDALVQEDNLSKKPEWVWSDSIRAMQPQDEPVVEEAPPDEDVESAEIEGEEIEGEEGGMGRVEDNDEEHPHD